MLPNLHLQIYRPNVVTLNYVNVGKKLRKRPYNVGLFQRSVNSFLIFASQSCKIIRKAQKKEISKSVWNAQHPHWLKYTTDLWPEHRIFFLSILHESFLYLWAMTKCTKVFHGSRLNKVKKLKESARSLNERNTMQPAKSAILERKIRNNFGWRRLCEWIRNQASLNSFIKYDFDIFIFKTLQS